MVRSIFFIFIFLSSALPSFAGFECFLNRISKVRSVEISFEQRTKLPVAGDEVSLYKGKILFKKPAYFRWFYTYGSDMVIVSDGKYVEILYPSDNECEVYALDRKSELFPLIKLLSAPLSYGEFFKVVGREREGDLERVELKPKYKDSLFSSIVLWFSGCSLKAFKTVQAGGTEGFYVVKEFIMNKHLTDENFQIRNCKEKPSQRAEPEGTMGSGRG